MMNGKKIKESDLDAIPQNPQDLKLDDKTSVLEARYQELNARSKNIYFILVFVAVFFCMLYISMTGNTYTKTISLPGALLFLIALGKWLEFPFILNDLERWHNLIFECLSKKSKTGNDEYEPRPNKNK